MNGDFIRHRASTGIGIVAFSQNSKRLYPRARFLDGCPLSDSNWLYHSMWYLLSEWLGPSCPRGGWSYDINQLLWPEVGWLYDRNQLVGPGIGWSYDINQLLWPEVGWLYDRNQLLWPGIGWSYDINQLLWPEVGCDRNQLLMSGIGCFFLFFFLVTQDVYSLHVYAFSLGLLCTRDFKQCPADPSERLLVLPSGPLSLFALCLPYPTGPLTHTRNHGGLVGCMIEINCYGPGSVVYHRNQLLWPEVSWLYDRNQH